MADIMTMEDFWDKADHPTGQQRMWGGVFVTFWNVVNLHAIGSGRTWFWKRVIRFIEKEDHWVREQ